MVNTEKKRTISWLTELFIPPPATKWALQIWLTCMWFGMSWRGTWCPWFCPTPSTALREARRLFTSTTCLRSSSRLSPASYLANLSSLSMWANGKSTVALPKHDSCSFEKLLKYHISRAPAPFPQGIPTLVNRHDRNYEIILKDVKAKVNQVSCDIQYSR